MKTYSVEECLAHNEQVMTRIRQYLLADKENVDEQIQIGVEIERLRKKFMQLDQKDLPEKVRKLQKVMRDEYIGRYLK